MAGDVLFWGNGRFAMNLLRQLQALELWPLTHLHGDPERGAPDGVCVTAITWTDPAVDQALLAACREGGLPLLRIFWDGEEVHVGPWLTPGEVGCALCLERRLAWNAADRAAYRQEMELHQRAGRAGEDRPAPGAHVLALAAALVAEEIARYRDGGRPRTQRAVYTLSARTLGGALHRFTPDPACPFCGHMQPDTREAVPEPAGFRLKPDPQTFRQAGGTPDLAFLRDRFVDVRTGIIHNEVAHPENGYFPVSEAKLVLPFRSEREPGVGRELSRAKAELVSILEALERHAGMKPQLRKTTVRGSYAALRGDALDPRHLILYTDEQIAEPGYPLARFDEHRPISWVWGYSFQRRGPVLVPEQAVYYGPDVQEEPSFLIESSNGCALGSCWEEAALHGLFELLERDALMLAWHARLPLPLLDLDRIDDREVLLLLDKANDRSIHVRAYDATTEFGVPCIWIRAGFATPYGTVVGSASGCHLNPERAVRGALVEALYTVCHLQEMMATEPERLERLAQNPGLIRTHRDHLYAAAWPSSVGRFDFLAGDRTVAIRERFPEWYTGERSLNLVDDLNEAAHRVLREGLDLIVVDQTPPELLEAGLHAARVLVPGTLPLTAGHRFRRVMGAERLLTVPGRLGYPGPRNWSEINPLPHPFA